MIQKVGPNEQRLRAQREARAKALAKRPAKMAKPDEAAPPAATAKESSMRKRKAKKAARGKRGAKRGAKTWKITALLTRPKGCTVKDVLKATGWPSISMPATAKAAGLKLRREKAKGEPTRYFGEPIAA